MLLGAGMVAAMCFQLWRALQLEANARAVEIERAQMLSERILRTAMTSHAVLDAIDPAARFVVREGRVVVDPEVGWLDTIAASANADPVVADRLARAERAEFVARDPEAAGRQFAELLAAPLPADQRFVVVAAAAWFHARRGQEKERDAAATELDQRCTALAVEDLGDERIANAVAAAARLPHGGRSLAWMDRLVPLLPPAIAAGLPDSVPRRDSVAAVNARRETLRHVAASWRDETPPPAGGLLAAGKQQVLWCLPADRGENQGALVSIEDWFNAVTAAGRAGALPEWPWLVEPDFAPDAAITFAGVPFVRSVRPRAGSALGERTWLLPAITLLLLLSFGVAAWQQLRAARRESAAVRAHAEFLTTVTHELRTPLASIRLLGEMLAEGRAQGREQQYYGMLASEAGRLSMLIENVLDLGRLERGERAYDLRTADFGAIVQETLALFGPVAERDGQHIEWRDELGGPAPAKLDRGAFVQALVCVLDNARKYGPQKDGTQSGSIDVTASRNDGVLALRIRDRGAGVPSPERERIFQRFVRGSQHAHGSTPGVGIGLYLARTIVRRMGGDLVHEEPADGPGACFLFTVPVEDSA